MIVEKSEVLSGNNFALQCNPYGKLLFKRKNGSPRKLSLAEQLHQLEAILMIDQ